MRFRYNLYPDARAKLDSAGITAKVNEARREHTISSRGNIMGSDVSWMVGDMKTRGYLKTFPQDQLKAFSEKANALFRAPEKHKWKVHRNDGVYEEPAEVEDVLSVVGYDASLILKPEEIWDFQKFGFRNMADFTGSITALVNEVINHNDFRSGYGWQTRTPDNRTLANEVTGDMNCDMRVLQTDLTPYKTIDPLGNEVSFRPEIHPDRGGIIAYHSTEGELLATILKYVQQRGLNPEALRENARATLEWAASLGQGGGSCTEHFFGGHDEHSTRMLFTGWGIPLVKLDKDDSTTQRSSDGIVTEHGGIYMAYLNKDDNLVFACEPRDKAPVPKKNIGAIYYPEDADHLVRGFLYQCAKGLGRTSGRQLRGVLEYRFSDQLEKDIAEMDARIRK